MAWVGIVDGQVLPLHWFQGSVTGQSYLDMLEGVVQPVVRGSATRKDYWTQQDGARVRTTRDVLNFLDDKFHGRTIYNGLEMSWPAKIPDSNPLDFYIWDGAEARVQEERPTTIQELKEVAMNFAGGV